MIKYSRFEILNTKSNRSMISRSAITNYMQGRIKSLSDLQILSTASCSGQDHSPDPISAKSKRAIHRIPAEAKRINPGRVGVGVEMINDKR